MDRIMCLHHTHYSHYPFSSSDVHSNTPHIILFELCFSSNRLVVANKSCHHSLICPGKIQVVDKMVHIVHSIKRAYLQTQNCHLHNSVDQSIFI